MILKDSERRASQRLLLFGGFSAATVTRKEPLYQLYASSVCLW